MSYTGLRMAKLLTPAAIQGDERVNDLLTRMRSYLPEEKVLSIQEAYEFARQAHEGQRRRSGEPYVEHPVQTALFLTDLHLDPTAIMAALLHDVMEDCGVAYEDLAQQFGDDVARLVNGVTKLSKMDLLPPRERERWELEADDGHRQAESLRKMLVAMAEDVRVVLIKLADRFHNMSTLSALPPHRQTAIAQETLDIYAPLAHRLGMWDIKWRLEDLALRHLNPTKYREISRLLARKRGEREQYIQQVTTVLKEELQRADINAEVMGRPKHIYSIYRKMQKYATQGKEFSNIYDLFAVRVLVKEVQDCYAALGVIHNLWHPVPGQFDDYIANPKENMYQSLHTTVRCIGGVPIEIQTRTYQMHQIAGYGVAAHWHYKEGTAPDMRFEEKMTWLRQLLEWQREVGGAEEFLESVKTDIFRDQVFVYTPKGDIKELPAGSTPIDFAYRIHTDLGHRCIGAKVNGKLVPLDYQLKSGDTVEVLTSKVAWGPSLDWLNPDLGYLRTANAREKAHQWFRKQKREANMERGRELLDKELRQLGVNADEEAMARLFRFESPQEFLAALGSGGVSVSEMAMRLSAQSEGRPQEEHPVSTPPTGPASGVQVLGAGDLLTRIAHCCSPLPGDEIVGFITRAPGVTVHKKNCSNVLSEDEKKRLVKVEWGQTQQLYPVRLAIKAWDRVGLLRDVTSQVSEERVNIASVITQEHSDEDTASIFLTLYITSMGQLGRLFSKLERVKGVLSVSRTTLAQAAGQSQDQPDLSSKKAQ